MLKKVKWMMRIAFKMSIAKKVIFCEDSEEYEGMDWTKVLPPKTLGEETICNMNNVGILIIYTHLLEVMMMKM